MLHDYDVMIPAVKFSNFNSGREIIIDIPKNNMIEGDQLRWFCGCTEGITEIVKKNGEKYTIKKVRQ